MKVQIFYVRENPVSLPTYIRICVSLATLSKITPPTQAASSTIILVNTATMIQVTPTLNSTFTSKSTFIISPTYQVTAAADINNYKSSLVGMLKKLF